MKQAVEQPVGDMTLEGLQEALRPAMREVVAEVITDVREEGFRTRYDQPTEVLISTMAVRVDEMEKDISEIKSWQTRFENLFETHRKENTEEAKAMRREMAEGFASLRKEFDAHRQDNAEEFKAVREEMAVEFKAVRQEMRRQLMWTVGTMIAIGSLVIAVVTLTP